MWNMGSIQISKQISYPGYFSEFTSDFWTDVNDSVYCSLFLSSFKCANNQYPVIFKIESMIHKNINLDLLGSYLYSCHLKEL